ncbi:MAG: hypothetical protein EF813_02810 [Methanosarcinales archaeon]|nr:MAG: hypothetical protein EF813_02810 [Methanosarcinales archaeon]
MYQQKRHLKRLAIVTLILTLSVIFVAHAAAETVVSVNAPEYELSEKFDVEIKIKDVHELASGEFCLLFDPNVVDVTDVIAGDIETMNIEFTDKRSDTNQGIGIIVVMFHISDKAGVSGSEILATVGFVVTGTDGTCSFLNISNPDPIYNPITDFHEGELWDVSTEPITAKWENGIVCIGDPSLFDDPPDSNNSTDSNTELRDTPEAKVTIFVENRDDDDLFVMLYIDGNFTKQEEIKDEDNEMYYDGRRLAEGDHIFEIRWHDHDTGKDYEKTKDCSVSGITAVTLMTDEHTEDDDKLSAHVHVMNLDDDALDVYLYIDGVYREYNSISSGSTDKYDEYDFEEDEDELHSFRIEWLDPGTNVTYEKIVRSHITSEEAVTLYVDKHTEADITVLSKATPTPVSTISRLSSTSTHTVNEPTPSAETQVTEMHTDSALTQDPIENSGMEQHISATCIIVAFVSVLFVIMQIRRI